MQTRRTRKITNKTKEQTGNQKNQKKKEEKKIRKDNPRTRERSQPATHHTNTKTLLPTTSQQGKTRATNRNITNRATNLRNENATEQRPQRPIHQQSHHPEWLISTNIRYITRYDVISRNEQTGRLTNKQQNKKQSIKLNQCCFVKNGLFPEKTPEQAKTGQKNLEKRWQV